MSIYQYIDNSNHLWAQPVTKPNKGLFDLLKIQLFKVIRCSLFRVCLTLTTVRSGSNLFCSYVEVSKSNINIFFLIMKLQHFVTPTFTRQIDVFASLLQYSTKIFSHKKVNGNTMIMILLNRFLWLLTNIFKTFTWIML